MSWVGRSIHRLEDPALVRGDGRFTGDLQAANWVRFVRSPVVTKASTGNRIHAFRNHTDAERHAATARGRILSGADRPFADE